ncbi:response regulator receiver protein [Candidatus Koribacter versatilis Ellin345]|uniref:Response regulator receiver protein n=1 Tax=Koribacter versatilis (strain Ellin345) TaxID=204669 RepID=Q1IVM3_KORVE|nr:response regulator [Candidatus Koribacter versatilis]ABF39077.1 response regulator receiver protein [Candidatus Koribacter versatilis Ellin345]
MALKILLADDSMTAQNMGKKILTDAGYEVVAVSNGAAAVKKIAEINPQLCILDIYMPGYTGLEVCEKIKSSSVTARIPVLLTVGKMEPYKPEEGARVRADGVIVKPFEASELLRAVHRFSQRIANVAQPGRPGAPAQPASPQTPPPPPASTPATYERTVKLTREQIQEYMEPGLQGWRGGTSSPEHAGAHARTEAPDMPKSPAYPVEGVVASMKTGSTSDAMPAFTISGAVAEAETSTVVAETSAAVAELETPAVPVETVAMETVAMPVESALAATEIAPVTDVAIVTEEPAPVSTEAAVSVAETAPPVPEIAAPAIEPEAPTEAPIASASSVLPGFVDYLIAHSSVETAPETVVPAEIAPETPVAVAEAAPETVAALETETPVVPTPEAAPVALESNEFAVSAPAEPAPLAVEPAPVAEISVDPALQQTADGVLPTGAGFLSDDIRAAHDIGHKIPAVDPALEITPEVAITATPDPHLESNEHIHVANATEDGLVPTSRSAESEGVVTTEDPNLSPMEGLTDAVLPLEGGRLIIEEPAHVAEPSEPEAVAEAIATETAVETPAETVATEAVTTDTPAVEAVATEAAPGETPVVQEAVVETSAVEAPVAETPAVVETPSVESTPSKSGKKARKGMRPIPATTSGTETPAEASAQTAENTTAPAETAAVAEAATVAPETPAPPVEEKKEAPSAKADVTEEIAAVLDLLGQTTTSLSPSAPGAGVAAASAAVEEAPAVVIGAVRVWMAEEVALSEAETTISLENEMRIAQAPKEVVPEAVVEPVAVAEPSVTAEVAPQPEAATAAPAEETVRDDKNAPQPAVTPDTGVPPPDAGASPTQELAAAMAAAFGGALPQEDLARAEETQSISEEVRRFAMGDAYKPKPAVGFGGAAIEDPSEKSIPSQDKLAAAISRALDRLKPQIVAEILKELEAGEEK